MVQRYEYKVETIREALVGDAVKPGKVQDVLNDLAKEGWQLKSLTAADVKGRLGPGATEGLLAVFERPVG
jgi:nitrogen regulatory protein PII